MSSVETTIEYIQDGMKKISVGIEKLKQAGFTDVVREEQLEKGELAENKADEMSRREIRE